MSLKTSRPSVKLRRSALEWRSESQPADLAWSLWFGTTILRHVSASFAMMLLTLIYLLGLEIQWIVLRNGHKSRLKAEC
jgi:hypothetical protein